MPPGGDEVFRDTITISHLAGGTTQPVVFVPWTVGPDPEVYYDLTLAVDLAGDNNAFNDTITAQIRAVEMTSVVGDEGMTPANSPVRLHGNFPNPFNPITTIGFYLPWPETVSLRIYDLAGRLVRTLYRGDHLDAGEHERSWTGLDESGRTVATGVFFYRLEAGSFSETRRMTLVK